MKWLVLPSCDEEFNGARLLIVRVRYLREKRINFKRITPFGVNRFVVAYNL